jgi:hypothetical protein
MVSTVAATTNSHVARWKNPSTSVFASRPATVRIDRPPCSPVSMWCHCRIWWRTMPSTNGMAAGYPSSQRKYTP